MPNGGSTDLSSLATGGGTSPNWYTGTAADVMGATPPAAPAATPPPTAPPAAPAGSRTAVAPYYSQPISYIPRPTWMPENAYNFLSMVPHYESDWKNVRNYLYNDDPSKGPIRTAQGLFQITNTNWRNFAPGLGIRSVRDPSQLARTAMDASPTDQMRVAYEVWKQQGELAWTAYNRPFAEARQRGVQARPPTPEELAGYTGGLGQMYRTEGMSATARKGLGLDGAGGVVPASYKTGEGGGVGGSPFTVDASGNLIDTRRGEMAPPVPPAAPTAPPFDPNAPPAPTGPPSWLSSLVGPEVANAIGSAPRGTVGTGGTGFLGGLTSLLTNPLTQGLAQGWAAAAQGTGVSPFARLSAGLAGLTGGVTEAERQQQLTDPVMRQLAEARLQTAQGIGAYHQYQAGAAARIGQTNTATADALVRAAAGEKNPRLRDAMLGEADAARYNTSKPVSFGEAYKNAQAAAGMERTEAQTTELIPAQVGALQSKADLDRALAQDESAKEALQQAQTALAAARKDVLPAEQAKDLAAAREAYGKLYDAQQSLLQKAGKVLWGDPGRDAYIEQQMQASGAGAGAVAPPAAPLGGGGAPAGRPAAGGGAGGAPSGAAHPALGASIGHTDDPNLRHKLVPVKSEKGEQWYYVDDNGDEYGPLTPEVLASMGMKAPAPAGAPAGAPTTAATPAPSASPTPSLAAGGAP